MPSDGMNNGKLRPRNIPEIPPEEEIVISGMSGRFPESDNMYQLHQNLMNKVDCITDDTRRWDLGKVKKVYVKDNQQLKIDTAISTISIIK